MDAAMGDEEIILRPLAEARVVSGIVRRAGRPEARMEVGRVLLIGDRRIEVRAAAEPAFCRAQEARVHVDGRHMRVGHVRDEARSEEHTSELQSLMRISYA